MPAREAFSQPLGQARRAEFPKPAEGPGLQATLNATSRGLRERPRHVADDHGLHRTPGHPSGGEGFDRSTQRMRNGGTEPCLVTDHTGQKRALLLRLHDACPASERMHPTLGSPIPVHNAEHGRIGEQPRVCELHLETKLRPYAAQVGGLGAMPRSGKQEPNDPPLLLRPQGRQPVELHGKPQDGQEINIVAL